MLGPTLRLTIPIPSYRITSPASLRSDLLIGSAGMLIAFPGIPLPAFISLDLSTGIRDTQLSPRSVRTVTELWSAATIKR